MSSEGFSFSDHSHRRFNPLTRTWVLCSPHRAKRPWLGQVEEATVEQRPPYDPHCYLCPGNRRATGAQNEQYATTYVFTNDYAAVQPDQPACSPESLAQIVGTNRAGTADLFQVQSTSGQCKVVCFSPRHDLTLPELPVDGICGIIRAWQDVYSELSSPPSLGIEYIQIFENKGAMMGCSNPHPHGQVWALSEVPTEPASEIASLKAFAQTHAQSHQSQQQQQPPCLLCAYVEAEIANAAAAAVSSTSDSADRIVVQNDSFVALVPFWAVWPFETMVIAKPHLADITRLSPKQTLDLAAVLKELTCRYDNIF
ncbi:galactose-1-phosphate uridyl transferase, partial [Coemansia sp. RSA 1804]